MNFEQKVLQLDCDRNEIFTELSELLPQNSHDYSLYLYHLRQLVLILARESGGGDYTSTLRLLTKIGAELPIS
jgi:hypothetical protein